MTKVLSAAALIAGLATSASAQGVFGDGEGLLRDGAFAGGIATIVVIIAAGSSSSTTTGQVAASAD